MPERSLVEFLDEKPLAEVINTIMKDATPSSLLEQMNRLEHDLASDLPRAMKEPLAKALANLKEAARQAGLARQSELLRALNAVLKREGLHPVTMQPVANQTPRSRGKRHRSQEIQLKVMELLPQDPAEGLPGTHLARRCGVHYNTMKRNLDELREKGMVVREGQGKSCSWHRKR